MATEADMIKVLDISKKDPPQPAHQSEYRMAVILPQANNPVRWTGYLSLFLAVTALVIEVIIWL